MSLQFAAELKVAASFTCHPLMTTVVASCQEENGSICLMMPYAGVNVGDIMYHSDWHNKLTEEERTEVFAEMAAHSMTVHRELQRKVRQGVALASSVTLATALCWFVSYRGQSR